MNPMKTDQDLENKVWYRLLKVVYFLFIWLVALSSIVIWYSETLDRDKMFSYSNNQITKIKNQIQANSIISTIKEIEDVKHELDGKKLKELFPKINDKDQDGTIEMLIAFQKVWYTLSGADFRDECYLYDNTDMYDVSKELEKFFSWWVWKFCRGFIWNDTYEKWEQIWSVLQQWIDALPYIQTFENNPTQTNMYSLRLSMSKFPDVVMPEIWFPNDVHYLYIISKIPSLFLVLFIEYLTFFLLIPKVFFYIILWKKH